MPENNQKITSNDRKVIGKECRFVVHVPSPEYGVKDFHLIKETVHYSDGTVEQKLNFAYDFKRPFYVTKKGKQTYKQAKEHENLNNVDRYMSTQTQLRDNVARALKMQWSSADMRKLSKNPYLFGSDISSSSIIKHMYDKKYPDIQSEFKVSVFDTERDVIYGTDETIMATISFKDKLIVAVQKFFVKGQANAHARILELARKYIGDYIDRRNIHIELVFVDTELEVFERVFERANEWKPDFCAIWNIDYDVNAFIDACKRRGQDPKNIISSKEVPVEYRYFKYKKGPVQKKKASGEITPIKPAAQWHNVITTASFQLVDAMQAYYHLRVGKGDLPSYSLDSVLSEELGIRKLKFKEADAYQKLNWHKFMQKNYPLEYVVYNMFDCISIEELDEKTKDLSLKIGMNSGCSDLVSFRSQPKRLIDDLHFYLLENKNKVIAASGMSEEEEEEDFDSKFSMSGFIITLPAQVIDQSGLHVVEEFPEMVSTIQTMQADDDITSAYPTNTASFNVSKTTTKREVLSVEGVDKKTMYQQMINFSGGRVNSAEFCQVMMGFPTFPELLKAYESKQS